MNLKSTLNYVCTSLWKDWNPLNWPLGMQVSILSLITGSMIQEADGRPSVLSDLAEPSAEGEENSEASSITFRCISRSKEAFARLGINIGSCLHHLEEVHPNLRPDSELRHSVHHDIIKYFTGFKKNSTVISHTDDQAQCKYFLMWQVTQTVLDIFKTDLNYVCNYIRNATDLWKSMYIALPNSESLSVWEGFANSTHCLGTDEMCTITQTDLFYSE